MLSPFSALTGMNRISGTSRREANSLYSSTILQKTSSLKPTRSILLTQTMMMLDVQQRRNERVAMRLFEDALARIDEDDEPGSQSTRR